ncbi:protein NATD1 [Scaptodrosophila lebanonensis]|uniref:Protein NATD1 n=1 Tax=Drosophila lebanonensis TaxID=7225 RepID=A0A6J2U3L7_DROLE|nr:protein NATD1 [Scaptodrosophila lebanonensis]
MSRVIVIQQDRRRFFAEINGVTATLSYRVNNGVMTILHTVVPEELSGRGIGRILAKAALDFALSNNLFLIIKCTFVENYIFKYEPHYAKYMLR